MNSRKQQIGTLVFAAIGMGLMIIDTKTALSGAKEGILLCIGTIIPSLFPFFVLSNLLTSAVFGLKSAWLRPIGRLFGIPAGSEALLIVGLLGGYPVGAQSVTQAYRAGHLKKDDARRMLGFCSNAGPAFIFGMASSLFESPYIPWILWAVHILSALFVSFILPGRNDGGEVSPVKAASLTLPQALSKAITVMAAVCGWIILFRVLIAFLQRWFLWLLPETAQIALIGLLELSNGCCELINIPGEGLRFLLCAAFLSFGGLCIAMQTASVTEELGMYLPGKLLQGLISILLAAALQPILFSGGGEATLRPWVLGIFACGILGIAAFLKINSRNPAAAGV